MGVERSMNVEGCREDSVFRGCGEECIVGSVYSLMSVYGCVNLEWCREECIVGGVYSLMSVYGCVNVEWCREECTADRL